MTDFLCRLFVKNYKDTGNPEVRAKYGIFSSALGIALNFLLASAKILLGFFAGSVAILADGINNLSDAGSSAVSFISFKIASKPADREHPFGHARIEHVASLVVSFLILYVGLDLIIDSVKSILGINPSDTQVTLVTIIALSLSIVFKLWLGFFYKSIAKKIDSKVIKASSQDSFSDCIATSAVLISSIIINLTDLKIIDGIVGLGVSVLIIIAGMKILLETINTILGEAPVKETVEAIERIIGEYPEIIGIHDMLVHDYGRGRSIASFHAEVNGEDDIYVLHDTIDNIERRIYNELSIQCTIHMDPIALNDENVNALKSMAKEVVEKIDDRITLHDFRAVIGTTHTNIIFDIVLPFESKYKENEIVSLIQERISEIRNDVFCVITVDRG